MSSKVILLEFFSIVFGCIHEVVLAYDIEQTVNFVAVK